MFVWANDLNAVRHRCTNEGWRRRRRRAETLARRRSELARATFGSPLSSLGYRLRDVNRVTVTRASVRQVFPYTA